MRETLTSSPELFSDISWNLLLLGEETAKKGLLDPVLGRENEINNLMRVLCRRNCKKMGS